MPADHTRPLGRYSPGIEVALDPDRSLLFISGQVAGDASGGIVGLDDPARQTDAAIDNLESVLHVAGGHLGDVVSVTIFVTDMRHFAAVSEVRNRRFSADPPPASTLVEVSRLAVREHLVEINAVAVVSHAGAPA